MDIDALVAEQDRAFNEGDVISYVDKTTYPLTVYLGTARVVIEDPLDAGVKLDWLDRRLRDAGVHRIETTVLSNVAVSDTVAIVGTRRNRFDKAGGRINSCSLTYTFLRQEEDWKLNTIYVEDDFWVNSSCVAQNKGEGETV